MNKIIFVYVLLSLTSFQCKKITPPEHVINVKNNNQLETIKLSSNGFLKTSLETPDLIFDNSGENQMVCFIDEYKDHKRSLCLGLIEFESELIPTNNEDLGVLERRTRWPSAKIEFEKIKINQIDFIIYTISDGLTFCSDAYHNFGANELSLKYCNELALTDNEKRKIFNNILKSLILD